MPNAWTKMTTYTPGGRKSHETLMIQTPLAALSLKEDSIPRLSHLLTLTHEQPYRARLDLFKALLELYHTWVADLQRSNNGLVRIQKLHLAT